ncbi:MAG: beta-propeller domain-containing protein [Actinomycetota bacterium]|nr:beta-propeller domain-containing protein [Actinomycetota bacterium]
MRRIVTTTAAIALMLSACTLPAGSAEPTSASEVTTTTVIEIPHPSASRALMPFDACDDLLDWTIGYALERVGPYGLDGYGAYPVFAEFAEVAGALDSAGGRVSQAPSTNAGAAKDGVIGTNLQEAGVDEPDLVKTDGRRIVAVSGSTLYVLDIDGDRLTLEGSIDLGFWTQDLFLDGDRVIAIADGGYDAIPFREDVIGSDGVSAPIYTSVLTVAEIDISDLEDPELTRTLRIDGRYVSSRMVDGAVRLIVSSGPTGFAWAYPEGGGLRSERDAEQKNREIIENSEIENWLPYFIVTDHEGRDATVDEGTLIACDRMHRPEEFSGFTTLSLVTLAPDALAVADSTGVFADGDIVYSSGDATYVATTRWQDPILFERGERPQSVETKIHKFSLSPSGADYQASGSVPGYMLSQWSMSEYDGYLRVASTDSPQWWDGPESESMVTVLDTAGDDLVTVGRVDGLGRGERIYSVRFFDDRGYVVTFRQVDPLYVIDLSDPKDPTVEGKLKIPGYSAYLHPIDGDHLLGVGQDADLDGRTIGLQASLFDVADPTDPERVDRFTMKDAQSELEWDHHAFLHDPASGLTVFPYQRWDDRQDGPPPTGALVLTVTEDGIRKAGVISHDRKGTDWWMPIRRALLIDGNLVTISDGGVMISDADTLETLDWVRF